MNNSYKLGSILKIALNAEMQRRDIAKYQKTSDDYMIRMIISSVKEAEAKKQKCGNCAAFIQTSAMLECIKGGLAQGDSSKNAWDVTDAGELGYCEAFDFKCASARTCRAWIVGGPITDKSKKK